MEGCSGVEETTMVVAGCGGGGGSAAVIRLSDSKLKTLGERGIECIFVRYVEHSKAFKFYVIDPNDSVSINSIIESRDAIFDENRFSSVPRPSLRIPNRTEDIGGSVVPEEVTKEVIQQPEPELRKSKRNRTPKDFGPEFLLYLIEGTRDEVYDQHSYCFNVEDDPKTFDEEIKSQDGFKQKSRIDYFDTYASVARISIIRLLIAMTSIQNLIIHQMDVKTAFLNGDLDEEQEPKQWHQKFNEVVLSNGYLLNQDDKCIYSKFDETGHGEADVILGIRIKHESNGIEISQSYYVENVVSQLEYSRVIGCLMYAMTCTRPDIAFSCGLTYTGYPLVFEGYTDASWISKTEDKSSTSGWVFLLGGGAISWASKKQTCIAGSTMESEFMALAAAGKEAEWLKNLFLEIPLWVKPIAPISTRCDSVATLANAYSQMYNGKSRYLGVRHSMIHKLITNGVISIEFLSLTKSLNARIPNSLLRKLGRTPRNLLGLRFGKAVEELSYSKMKTLGERGIECIFVRYVEHSKAFKFYVIDPNDSVLINSIIESRGAIFDENRFSSVPRPSLRIPNRTEDIGGSVVPEKVTKEMDVKTTFLNGDLDEEVLYEGHGEADVILGIRIKHESNEIEISQSHYVENVLKKFNYFDCTNNPSTQYWQVIQRVLKYLKKTIDYRLTYTGYPLVLEGYTDASWINKTEDKSSTSGWVFLLVAGKEAEWLKNLFLEIPLWVKPIALIFIRCDSASTLANAYSQMYNGKSRHLGVRHSMIHKLITNGVISIESVRSQ
ncbi:zinc finger, CCHC-type containing protein [Tanacetum coccineum]|uniref:Zinc finger, CCHC-type containing protein n=1 Tax=Tanacetum coccineum TaxID=301880 RepID=A0ABQ5AVH3_9ASTR